VARQLEVRLFGRQLFEVRSDKVRQLIKDNWLSQIYGSNTKTGKLVNENNATAVSAVWSCIQVYSNTFAMVPLNVYRKEKDKRIIDSENPIHILIHSRPNVYMTSFTWRRAVMMQCASNGNSYTIIERNGYSGRPVALSLVINSRDVKPYLVNGKLWYSVKDREEPVPAEDMIHFMWNTRDGFNGLNPIEIARENIGQALAIQEYGSRVFSEGGAKRVALKTPGKLTPDQKDSWRKTWKEKYGGLDNMHELAIVEGAGELIEIGMNPEDAQFVQVMKFKIEEIARIYNVPLHMIQSLDHATNNNIEHQSMQFVTHTMMPHYVNFEQELDYKLFGLGSKNYTKHTVNALLRGDAKTRAFWYRTMSDLGAYSINDMLKKEDENPIEGGDGHYVQVNRIPLDKMDKVDQEDPSRSLAEEAKKRTNGHSKVEVN